MYTSLYLFILHVFVAMLYWGSTFRHAAACRLVRGLGVMPHPFPHDYIQALRGLRCDRGASTRAVEEQALRIYQAVSKQIDGDPYAAQSKFSEFLKEDLFLTKSGWFASSIMDFFLRRRLEISFLFLNAGDKE